MKLITDTVYGHQRAYIGAVAVVWIHGWYEPTAGVCIYATPLVKWRCMIGDHAYDNLTFQPDPSKLQPGEWCWPVMTPPVTPERIKEVRRMCAVSYDCAWEALNRSKGEIDDAVKLLGGEKRYMGKCRWVACVKDATCRDDYDLSSWCDEHVPEGRTVWRSSPAVITSQSDADALLGKGAIKMPDVQPQIHEVRKCRHGNPRGNCFDCGE